MQPAFHKKRLQHMLDIINEEATAFIDKLSGLPDSTPVNFSHEILQLNISIISRAMFSATLQEDMNTMVNVLEDLTSYASVWMKSIIKIPTHWPTPANNRFNNNCKIFDDIIYKIIDERKKYRSNPNLPGHEDLLDMLMDYVDEDTRDEMTERQLRDEVTTIFIAGHETTSQTLGWIFYQLAKEKKILQKVKNETNEIFNKRLPGLEDLPRLNYTKQVIQEGMRHYPSVCALVRKPYEDDCINGIKIPASSNVLINIYGMHHHAGYWSAPDDFDPAHFNDGADEQRVPFVYLPFGGGPRLCIGSNFAMMVMQVVVSRLSQAFDFDVPEGYVPKIEPNITIRAKGGIRLLVSKPMQ
jgi:cytochrome P450